MARLIAITGGTGFIGRHLAARHVAQGDKVRFLTRKKSVAGISGAEAYVGDLAESEILRRFVHGVDVLYHCAAELHEAANMERTNVLGTANLLDAAVGEVGRWVQLSSTGLYGAVRNGTVREEAEMLPNNPYERSKAAADALVLAAAERRGLSCVLLRPSNVYGADMPNQSLFQLIRMIDKGLFFFIGPPGAMANYIHVENVVDALLHCAETALSANGRSYIVSDHCTLEELVCSIAAHLDKEAPRLRLPELPVRALAQACSWISGFPLKTSRVDALTNRVVYCSERIEAEMGHHNLVSMDTGMGELVRCWQHGAN
ncbi:MAG: NAD-dependent epimerase/dehydratase family protein [Gammaproteobacteria bacterium]|nr:NAD-dependent epimerase/dehydratase family protein [Gammaproteobacteria bacterium]MBU1624042.1 NAD-dependent epimerase/dehydratase family protein [Gammaproteobacteria bacterium]MBU1981770.1 NAD-dependent epimerase/dehydratase family protein [Gammaproteobacteria bacterium]